MKLLRTLWLTMAATSAIAAANNSWVPDGLPPLPPAGTGLGGYLKPEQGKAVLDAALARFPDRNAWDSYSQHVRQRIQEAAGLSPWPRRTPLNPVVRLRREYDGYSVENVVFEAVPGCLVTGNLYRPLHARPPYAAVLSTHGHNAILDRPANLDDRVRLSPTMQVRCATLARMGAVVLSIDMFGYGDSMQIFGHAAHKQPLAFTIQTWSAIRAVDYLLSIDGVDPKRIGVSGESGGGTQSFILAALDPRVAVSMPVVMVSSYFFGGCPCESGRPIHRSSDHFVNNTMIAALAAPRPMLTVSDGADWTQHALEIDEPFLQRIYAHYGAEKNFAHVHLAAEKHDYGPSKREAMYRFAARHLGLKLDAILGADGKINESHVQIEKISALRVFDADFPIPGTALHEASAVDRVIRELQR